MNDQHQLLTVTEAATLLRVPVATLRYWRHLGTGPCGFRAGRHVLYRLSDLRNWIDQQANASNGDQAVGRGGVSAST
jgi:excisionase family DNA binding protein